MAIVAEQESLTGTLSEQQPRRPVSAGAFWQGTVPARAAQLQAGLATATWTNINNKMLAIRNMRGVRDIYLPGVGESDPVSLWSPSRGNLDTRGYAQLLQMPQFCRMHSAYHGSQTNSEVPQALRFRSPSGPDGEDSG